MGKGLQKEPLKPMWKGPYSVILNTLIDLKVAGTDAWIHYSRVKPASPTDSQEKWETTLSLGNKHPKAPLWPPCKLLNKLTAEA